MTFASLVGAAMLQVVSTMLSLLWPTGLSLVSQPGSCSPAPVPSRAIENQCYLVGVNRVGDDEYSHYVGASVVVDPIGRTLAQCRRNVVQALTVHLDKAELERRRQKFRVLDDRDEQLTPL